MAKEELKMTPGDLEAVESAEAYANRVNRTGIASERPGSGEDDGAAAEGARTESGELPPPAHDSEGETDGREREGADFAPGAPRIQSDPGNPLV
jgi:hypothetical protein